MRQHTFQGEALAARLMATPRLRAHIDAQGRRLDWIASRLGWSKSHVSKVVAGQRCITVADARVIVALVDGDLAVLFELSSGSYSLPGGRSLESGS